MPMKMSPSKLVRTLASASGAGRMIEMIRNRRRARQADVISAWHRKNEVVFVHIPKTAGSSIREAMGDPTPDGFQHTAAKSFQEIDHAFFDRAFTFAVVREPISRFCSALAHLQKLDREIHDPIFRDVEAINDIDYFLTRFERSWWFRAQVFAGLHFQKQWYYVTDWRGREIVDELIAFEDLEDRFPDLVEQVIGHSVDLGHANPSHHILQPEDVSPRMRAILERHYRRDFELYEKALAQNAAV